MEDNREIDFLYTEKDGSDFEEIKSENPGAFIHSNNLEGTNLYIGGERITDNYNTSAEDSWETVAVGGISKGTKSAELKGKSVSDILDAILYPTIVPTVKSNPSVSISYASGSYNVSVGRGSFSNGTVYAGAYTYDITDNGGIVYATAHFGEGVVPKDNKGNDVPALKYPGGDVKSNTLYAMYCNGSWMSSKESLFPVSAGLSEKRMTSSTSVMVAYAPQADGGEPFRIYLKGRNISSFKTLSDMTNDWSASENRGGFVKNGTETIDDIVFDVWELVNSNTGNAKILFELN